VVSTEREGFVHTPPTAGGRLSGVGMDVNGGKSVDCNGMGGCICWEGRRGGVFACGTPLRLRGGVTGDMLRVLLRERSCWRLVP